MSSKPINYYLFQFDTTANPVKDKNLHLVTILVIYDQNSRGTSSFSNICFGGEFAMAPVYHNDIFGKLTQQTHE